MSGINTKAVLFKAVVYIFLFISINYSTLLALNPEQKMNRFTTECFNSASGLPQNTVADIYQDKEGYLYFATQEGAVKYDGKKFETAGADLFPGKILKNVQKIKEDENGRVSYATATGVFSDSDKLKMLDGMYVNDFVYEKNGTIWIATYSSGIIKISPDNQKTIYDRSNNGINSNIVTDILIDSNGKIFVTTLEGLSYFEGGAFAPVDGIYAFSYRMAVDKKGWLWVATERGLALVKNLKLDYIYTKEDGLKSDTLRSVYADSSDAIWIGTDKGEILRFFKGQFSYLPEKTDHKFGAVVSMVEDREKNIWFGTEVTGTCIIREGSVFQAGINSGNIRSITETSDGEIWAATFGDGIKILKKDETVETLNSNNGLRNDSVTSVFADKDNRIWMGTRRSGVQVFSEGKIADFDSLVKNFSQAIPVSPTLFFQDSRNNIWIADRHSTRPLFMWKDGILKSFEIKEGEISVLDIAENRSGTIFFATMKDGVFSFDSARETFSQVDFKKDTRISSLFIDEKERLWAATLSKGIIIKLETGFIELNESNGLYSNTIHDIVKDDKGFYWFSTNKGVFNIKGTVLEDFITGKLEKLSYKVFKEEDGMKAGECNGGSQPSILKSSDGTIWFPTINGIVTIDPDKVIQDSDVPPVLITGILIDNSNYVKYSDQTGFTIPAGSKSVEIFFTSLYFSHPGKVNFDYFLDGFDSDWNKAGNKRSVKYTNIYPGNYLFSVKSYISDSPDKFSTQTVSLEYVPLFYQNLWFRALAGIFVILVIFTAYYLKIKIHKLREKELRTMVDQRTEELVKANEKLKLSILKDPMTGLCNRRYLFEIEQPRYERLLFSVAKNIEKNGAHTELKVTGLFLIDIGGLKKINEKRGYDFGDRLLVAFAETLKKSVRKDDLVVRWGGDEFLVLLNTTNYDHLPVYAKKIEEIAHNGIEMEGEKSVELSLSIGFSAMPFYNNGLNALNFEESLLMSDMALFRALSEGTGKIKQIVPGNSIPSKEEVGTFMKDINMAANKGFFSIIDI